MAISTDVRASASADSLGATHALVLDHTGASSSVKMPSGEWLLHAEFSRDHGDLLLTGADGAQVLVRGFFDHGAPPSLVADQGWTIDGDLAARLAGPLAPGQYAQAAGGNALEAVGTVSKLAGDVQVRHPDGTGAALKAGDAIHVGDIITTGGGGRVGITFDDGTVLSLGGSGRMTIDEFVYDPKTAKGSETVSLVTGKLALTSGDVAKTGLDAMVLRTPVATLGIRGTDGLTEVQGPGRKNTFSLVKGADGTVGEISVRNQAGTQVLSKENETTQVASATQKPSDPYIAPANELRQQFNETIQFKPQTPTREQIEQQRQQRSSDSQTEKAIQQAKATSAEKTVAEKAAAEKALGEKLAAEKAQIAKIAAEKGLSEAKVGEVMTKVLGANVGQFSENGLVIDTAKAEGKIGNVLNDIGKILGLDTGTVGFTLPPVFFDKIVPFEYKAPESKLDLGSISQTSIVHVLASGAQTINLTAGVNDVMKGTAASNEVSVSGTLTLGDVFIDDSNADADTMTINSGATNTFAMANVETLTLSGAGTKNVTIGDHATTAIDVSGSGGADHIVATAIPLFTDYQGNGNQTWNVTGSLEYYGGTNTDYIDMDSGTDTLVLLTASTTHQFSLYNTENVTFNAGGNYTVGMNNAVSGVVFTGNSGTDVINLANGTNSITVNAVETVAGGTGTDTVTLGSASNISVSAVESVVGSSGNDTINLNSTSNLAYVNGNGGTNIISGASTLASLDLSAVTLTNITKINTGRTAGCTITGSSGNDSLEGNTGADTFIGGTGADTMTGSGGANVFRYTATTDFSGGSDTITAFVSTTDSFQFKGSAFNNLSNGTLNTLDGGTHFVSGAGATANAATTQFVFDTTSKILYYDADGNGAGAATAVVTITSGTVVAADIAITAT